MEDEKSIHDRVAEAFDNILYDSIENFRGVIDAALSDPEYSDSDFSFDCRSSIIGHFCADQNSFGSGSDSNDDIFEAIKLVIEKMRYLATTNFGHLLSRMLLVDTCNCLNSFSRKSALDPCELFRRFVGAADNLTDNDFDELVFDALKIGLIIDTSVKDIRLSRVASQSISSFVTLSGRKPLISLLDPVTRRQWIDDALTM